MPNQRAPDKTRLTISLDISLKKQLEAISKREDIPISNYLRRLAREDIARYQTRHEAGPCPASGCAQQSDPPRSERNTA